MIVKSPWTSETAQSCPTLRSHGLWSTRFLHPRNFPGKSTGMGCHFLHPGDLPDPGTKPRSPALQADTLLSEPPPAATAKLLQSCPTLCNPIDGNPPGSPVPGILQERILEWVAISFSNAWKWKMKGKSLSRVWLLATPWTAAYQAPPSMGFSRQEYWSVVPLLSLVWVTRKAQMSSREIA